jgi:hypothetical protein
MSGFPIPLPITSASMATIYALCDSREPDPIKRVRYVGQTVTELDNRLARHRWYARVGQPGHRSNWIRSVERDGGTVLIEAIKTNAEWNATEVEEIARHRAMGCDLTNATDGGGGALGYIHDEETRKKMRGHARLLGHVYGEETREKHRQRICSVETIEKMCSSACHGDKNVNAKLTWPQVAEIRTRCASGETGKALAVEFRVSRASVSRIVNGKRWVAA